MGCTCLSVDSPLLRGRAFDACIVDEAGQITLPAVLGALQLARSFCLVRGPIPFSISLQQSRSNPHQSLSAMRLQTRKARPSACPLFSFTTLQLQGLLKIESCCVRVIS